MPSPFYDLWKPVFDRVCQSGIDPYLQQTGVQCFRVVANVPIEKIEPFYSPDAPGRGKEAGEFVIYAADTQAAASLEKFGNNNFIGAPTPTCVIAYTYSGTLFNIDLVTDYEFKASYSACSGENKHLFSQDFKHHLRANNLIGKCDAIGWQSVSGQFTSNPGYVLAWHSGTNTTLIHDSTVQII